MHIDIQGIEYLDEDEQSRSLRVGAGQVWHEFVLYTTTKRLYGLQNLALIPGRVGASPVQNIGAYGVEAGILLNRYKYMIVKLASLTRSVLKTAVFHTGTVFLKISQIATLLPM